MNKLFRFVIVAAVVSLAVPLATAVECPEIPDPTECLPPDAVCPDVDLTTAVVHLGGEGSLDTRHDCECTPASDAEGNAVEADLTYEWDRDTAGAGTLTLYADNLSPVNEPVVTVIWFNAPDDVSSCSLVSAEVNGSPAGWELLSEGIGEGCLGDFEWQLRTTQGSNDAIPVGGTGVFVLDCTGSSLLAMDACQFANAGTTTEVGERSAVAAMHFQRSGTSGEESEKVSNCAEELFVDLASFSATPRDGEVLLEWLTLLEVDNAGFYLVRRNVVTGETLRLNPGLIPAQGDIFEGAYYRFLDETAVNGVLYEYFLVDVELSGAEGHRAGTLAVPNPQSTPVRLVAPAYGSSELRAGSRPTFSWESESRRNAVLVISSDPTFASADSMIVGARNRREITLGLGQTKHLETLAKSNHGVVYWRVLEPTVGSELIASPTFSVGYAVFSEGQGALAESTGQKNVVSDNFRSPRRLRRAPGR